MNTEDFMTTPEEFKSKTTESLEYLDLILPEGSGVVVTGLAQGYGVHHFRQKKVQLKCFIW